MENLQLNVSRIIDELVGEITHLRRELAIEREKARSIQEASNQLVEETTQLRRELEKARPIQTNPPEPEQ